MTVKTYSPSKIQVIIAGNVMSGFAEGTFVGAEREDDAFTKHVGADGEVGRTQSANKSGEVTLTLAQYSASNDVLSSLAIADELTASSIFPVIIKDSGGTTILFSGEGWVRKLPAVEFSDEITDREWVLDMAKMEFFVGGN